jgi:peptidoglycan/LPS O-acetylase OafA/YrhL
VRYRAEIDGLRAIAVGAVLLYHGKLGLPGGFVGVDVFFVISGYLITCLILRDLQTEGGFSLVDFWKRRIRRIFPALLLVLISTFVLGWFFLLPSHFKNLGESLMFQGAFLGNFYFWGSVGYFGDSTYTIPLLHTWSLAVEEQFYILFPLIALILYRKSKNILLAALAILAGGSLFLSQYQLHEGYANAAFYLLPSRAWELLAGCLLAFIPERESVPSNLRKMGGWLGVVILLGSFLFFNESMPFPGLTALGPVAGTAFVI